MRGYFGIGVYHSKHEVNIGSLMRSAYCFGASFVFTVGRRYTPRASDTTKTILHLPCYHYDTLDSMLNHIPVGCRVVGVELAEGAWEVGRYSHPDRAIYLLGAEDHGIPPRELARCHDVIVIPGASRCLNVAAAGSIVLFDRTNYMRNRPVMTREIKNRMEVGTNNSHAA